MQANLFSRRNKIIALSAGVVLLLIGAVVTLAILQNVHRRTYTIHQIQGQSGPISLASMPPANRAQESRTILVLYLHGLGGTFEEPFKYPSKRRSYALSAVEKFPDVVFASCDYGNIGTWGSDTCFGDVTSAIKELSRQFPFKSIVLAGSSMGAATVLTYATQAPEEIRRKIIGLVVIYPTGDLLELYQTTSTAIMRLALEKGLGGTPESVKSHYINASFFTHLNAFPHHSRVSILSADQDKSVRTRLQRKVASELEAISIPVQLETVTHEHYEAPRAQHFAKGLAFVLNSGN